MREQPLSERRLAEGVAAAQAIAEICRDVKARQTTWLHSRGLTWEQARALPADAQQALQQAWQKHHDSPV